MRFFGTVPLIFTAIASVPLSANPQAKSSVVTVIKVNIKANQWNTKILLKKLNDRGKGHHLEFVIADSSYDYRIEFGIGQKPVGTVYGDVNASDSFAAVYDAIGNELFNFNRQGRMTDAETTNATAKEIIKRLLKLRAERQAAH